jgi:membrane dipeptidase
MHHLRATITLILVSSILRGSAPAQSITINGSAKDKLSLLPVDSATIELVNKNNSSEHYKVVTNSTGGWSYTFQPSGVADEITVPTSLRLAQNYPNPFNPSTRIEFSLDHAAGVKISVHNILGQKVDERTADLSAGYYSIEWQSRGSSGVLFYSIEMNGTRVTRKMIQLDGGSDKGGLGNIVSSHRIATRQAFSKASSSDFNVIASKLGYEADTIGIVLVDNARADFLLETVHSRAFVIDLHNDVCEKMINGYQIGIRHTTDNSDIPRFRDGGVDAQMFAIWVNPIPQDTGYYNLSMAMIDTFTNQVSRNSAFIAQARTTDEIGQVNSSGKLAGILAVEGGHAIENDLENLKAYYAKGARYFTITWNNSTAWATSAKDPQSATKGLSEFGKQVIRTLDSLGMIIDVAHTGIKTIQDILAITKNPIIDSHCGVYKLRNHYRNLKDDQIDSIANRGGVIGVVFYTDFLAASKVTIDTVIKHIDYIKNLVGIDYVAIGSDFDGGITPPVGLEDVSKLPALTLALLKHGYSPSDVKKILGENYLRVFKQVCH